MMYALLSSDKKSQICLTTITLRLAKEGLVLEQSYVQPICTPTRWAKNIDFLKTWNIYVNEDIFDHPLDEVCVDERIVPDPHGTPAQRSLAGGASRIENLAHSSAKATQLKVFLHWRHCQAATRGRICNSHGGQVAPGLLLPRDAAHKQVGQNKSRRKWKVVRLPKRFGTVKVLQLNYFRGFDTFYGYYTGSEHYFNHTRWSSCQSKI